MLDLKLFDTTNGATEVTPWLAEEGLASHRRVQAGNRPGVIYQGPFHLSWPMDHRAEFEHLVRDRLGARAGAQVLWSGPG